MFVLANQDTNQQEPYFKYLAILAGSIFVGVWAKTQYIASQAHYADYLENVILPIGIKSGISIAGFHLYVPNAYMYWAKDTFIIENMPDILRSGGMILLSAMAVGAFIVFSMHKKYHKLDSHGTADFANAKDIEAMGLNATDSGVVCGRNPFTDKLLLHNGPEHIFLAAPTRSGKGVGVIIPTGIIWKNSIFFFDPKAELWASTAGFRQKYLHQKVLKFEPLCKDHSGARWNPYAEINFQSFEEVSDVTTINETMVKTGENTNSDPFWNDSAINVLNGVVLHLLYKNCQEKRELPCPTDTYSYISSPNLNTDQLFSEMMVYPHISPEEFMELEINGKKCRNPLKEIYGVYYTDFAPIVEYLQGLQEMPLTKEEYKSIMEQPGKNPTEDNIRAFENLRLAIVKRKSVIKWGSPLKKIRMVSDAKEIKACIEKHKSPLYKLLVHPKISESAANILNGANETRQSILSSAKTPLALYQDPLIKQNTCVSDFSFRDLLDPKQAVSLYMVLQPNDIDKLRPLTRLFVNTMIAKTVRDMKFDGDSTKKQRLLLMLDEFPQLKKMETIGNTLAICAGYGVKICIVVQNITQLNEIYTKDGSNKIISNSQVQIYMTPSEYETAKVLSDTMGTKTIITSSVSSNGTLSGGSTSRSEQQRNLMNPDEILRMDRDKNQLVLVQGGKPIMAKKIRWYNEPYFKKRAFAIPAPMYSDTCTEVKDYPQLFGIHAAEVEDMRKKQEEVAKARGWSNEKTEETDSAEGHIEENQEEEKIQQENSANNVNNSPKVIEEIKDDRQENIEPAAESNRLSRDEAEYVAEQAYESTEHCSEQTEKAGATAPSWAWSTSAEEIKPANTLISNEQVTDFEISEGENNSAEFKDFLANINAETEVNSTNGND